MKEFFQNMYKKPHIVRRLVLCFVSVCMMGFCVYWFDRLVWGTDPCSVTNLALAAKFGLSLGNLQAIVNTAMFIIVIWRDKKQIGFGTFFNMFLVGYSYNFMGFIMEKAGVDYHFPKIRFGSGFILTDFLWCFGACIILLILFVVFASIYMSVELGTAPYDALSVIIANSQKRFSFRVIRIFWDGCFAVIGFLLGGTVGLVTILMVFTIGPMVAWTGKKIKRFLE
ncbi:Uncharacterized membrane protein YczE [Eubacterium ruminantium]|nr:Uncharacterized membrane protein YczE [Eubacterium ruminantium]